MALFDFFARSSSTVDNLPEIYPIPITQKDFVSIDVEAIYSRILTDVLERTQNIKQEVKNLLFDNCMASEKQEGLITLLSKAIASKSDLFLVYIPGLKVVRKATETEQETIKQDYIKKGESSVGIYITFRNMNQVDMLRFYSVLEYCTVNGLWTMQNMSKALQLKFHNLRGSVSLADKADVEAQGLSIANALKSGKAVQIDEKDSIETGKPDLTAHEKSMMFINHKKSYYLGLPASYITGEQSSSSMSDTGKSDSKAVDRGLKPFYFSIIKPVVEGLFNLKTDFKTEDSEGLATALEVLKTMDQTSDEYMGKENKTIVVNKAFGLDIDEKGDEPEGIPALPAGQQRPPPQQ